jgi:hypothetical protein
LFSKATWQAASLQLTCQVPVNAAFSIRLPANAAFYYEIASLSLFIRTLPPRLTIYFDVGYQRLTANTGKYVLY